MRRGHIIGMSAALLCATVLAAPVLAQQMPMHGASMQHEQMGQSAVAPSGIPASPGQDAFGAIQEIVRILEADPTTDWSKVSLERLRQHLIDMNDVTLQSEVKSTVIPGGLAMEATGTGRTEQAIRRMVVPHTAELNKMTQWSAQAEEIPGGIRLTVVANNSEDTKTVSRIRGLGFIGLLTEGVHHQMHHLAMARGEAMTGHAH